MKKVPGISISVSATAQKTCLTALTASKCPGQVYNRCSFEDTEVNNTSSSEASRQSHLPHGRFNYKTSHMLCTVVCSLHGLRVCHLSVVFEWGLKMDLT